jgi:preprotein translocase subunit YajC
VPVSLVPLAIVALTPSPSPSGGSSGGGGSSLGTFVPLLLILAVGYFLLVRPARARQRRALDNRSSLAPGVEVTTTAGLLATVVAVDDDAVTLEVAPGVHSRYVKGAIAQVRTPFEPPDEEMIDAPADDVTPEEPTESPTTDPTER